MNKRIALAILVLKPKHRLIMKNPLFLRGIPFIGLFLVLAFIASCTHKAKSHFPEEHWQFAESSSDYGFSMGKLKKAESYSKTINTAAVVIVKNGLIIYEWGEADKKFMTHSMRKSFLSAMYGKYVENGTIDLETTLEDLNLDDVPELSPEEKQATIRDCIKARSGIYHTALYESQGMKDLKPARFTEKAGIHWYYNNYDFNISGYIFEKLTGQKTFETIKQDIANPIQMEDFQAEDGWYVTGEESIYPAYPFRITAHDCARFGLLMLNKGNWNGKQVISESWVDESTRYHSDATLYGSDGYGYMWWVSRDFNKFPHLPNVDLPEGTYSARGAGGHYILIIPEKDLVIVHRVDTDIDDNRVSKEEFGTLVDLILDAEI